MIPFTLTCTLNLPLVDGQPAVAIPLNFSGQYKQRALFDETLSGSGSMSVPMGNIGAPGALLIVIEHVATTGAAPILVKYNGASQGKELAPGSGDLYFNAAPASGVTTISFDYTTACRVRAWILGG